MPREPIQERPDYQAADPRPNQSLGDVYTETLQDRELGAAMQRLQESLRQREQEKAATGSGNAQQRQGAAKVEQTATGTPPSAPAEAKPPAMQAEDLADRRELSVMTEIMSGTGTALRDVAIGTRESLTRGVGGGFRDAFQFGLLDVMNDTAEWLETRFPLGGWEVRDDGLRYLGGEVFEMRGGAARFELPDVPQPDSVTGGVIRTATQFMVGFIPLLRGARALRAPAGLSGVAAGAATDALVFDPHEERLSDLWAELGLPENQLTEFLASDPEDSAILGRFKNAIEGALLGGAVEFAPEAIKALSEGIGRAGHIFRVARAGAGRKSVDEAGTVAAGADDAGAVSPSSGDAAATPPAGAFGTVSPEAKWGTVEERDFLILGDPRKPLFEVKPKSPESGQAKIAGAERRVGEALQGVDEGAAARGLAESGATAEDFFVNFARIETPDDVQSVIGQMADAFKGDVEAAARGVQTHQATEQLAEDLGLTVPELLARRRGEPLNAEQSLAARRLLNATGAKLLEAARAANGPAAGATDQFNFRRMLAIHSAVQNEVFAARREVARALNAWAIPAGGGVEQSRHIQMLIDNMGGPAFSQELARRLVVLDEQGATAAGINAVVRQGWAARSSQVMRHVWINAMLSSPKTHIVNITSNMMVAGQQIYERAAAGQIGRIMGTDGGVQPQEASAMAFGLVEGMKDVFRLGWKEFTARNVGHARQSKIDAPDRLQLGARTFNLEGTGALGRTADFMGAVVSAPGTALELQDHFFQGIGYRMNVHALAARQAAGEGLTGDALKARAKMIADDPPESIRLEAADAALYQTFTNQAGKFARSMMRARESFDTPFSPLPYIAPFIRTPANIVRYGFERTPLAPLMSHVREDIAAGGARRDLALARIGTGTAIMTVFMDLAALGVVTGSGHPNADVRATQRRLGMQPYSVRFGDRWYSFNRLDPLGLIGGMAADTTALLAYYDLDDDAVDEASEIIALGIAAASNAVFSKSYMQSISEFMEMITDAPRYSESYIQDFVASFVPAVAGAIETAVDPRIADVNSVRDALQARIAGLASRLPVRKDLWGYDLRSESGLGRTYDFLSPATARPVKSSPIDEKLLELNAGVRRPDKKTTFAGVNVDLGKWPRVYERYQELAGHALKLPHWGGGAKDVLDKLVTGKHRFSATFEKLTGGRDGGQTAMIHDIVNSYRAAARMEILRDPEFADFQAYWNERRLKQIERKGGAEARERAARTPVLGGVQ